MLKYLKMTALGLSVLLISGSVGAQTPPGMDQQDLQNMMQKMQKMQVCMENVDKSELDGLKKRSDKFQAEIKSLCAQNRRDKAQSKAVAFARDFSQSKSMKQMTQCAKIMEGAMPQMELPDWDKDYENVHVCDGQF